MINFNGKTYIIPANKVGNLVIWLESNAIQPNTAPQPRMENRRPSDPRQLLCENA
jgi:hypothetical protein